MDHPSPSPVSRFSSLGQVWSRCPTSLILLFVCLQRMFHHIFVCCIADIGNQVNSLGAFSIEFEEQGQMCYLSIRFWKEDFLCKVTLTRFGRTVPVPQGHLGSLSKVLSAISTKPGLVCCSGCPVAVFQSLDESPTFPRGIQYPFRLDEFKLSKLMHRESFSVFGRIDFFTVLEHLVLSLSGILDQSWTHDAPELVKVSQHDL